MVGLWGGLGLWPVCVGAWADVHLRYPGRNGQAVAVNGSLHLNFDSVTTGEEGVVTLLMLHCDPTVGHSHMPPSKALIPQVH